jgi:hypothetical protein
VGLYNTRLFLSFLGANLLLCIYGGCLTPIIMLGELKRSGILHYFTPHPKTKKPVPLYTQPARYGRVLSSCKRGKGVVVVAEVWQPRDR